MPNQSRDPSLQPQDWFERVVRGESFGVDVLAALVKGLDSRRARTFLGSFTEVPKPLLSTISMSQRTLDQAIETKKRLKHWAPPIA